jgi:hypothetical protein
MQVSNPASRNHFNKMKHIKTPVKEGGFMTFRIRDRIGHYVASTPGEEYQHDIILALNFHDRLVEALKTFSCAGGDCVCQEDDSGCMWCDARVLLTEIEKANE